MSSALPSQPDQESDPSLGPAFVDGANHPASASPNEGPLGWWALRYTPPPPAEYVVPRRFGMSAIVGVVTALSLLYGGLHWVEAWPVYYAFIAVQVLLVCLVQMFYGKSPRVASAIAGAVLGPIFTLCGILLGHEDTDHELILASICLAAFMVPFGAFLGYLTGTCAAGVFLVTDKLEHYWQSRRPAKSPEP